MAVCFETMTKQTKDSFPLFFLLLFFYFFLILFPCSIAQKILVIFSVITISNQQLLLLCWIHWISHDLFVGFLFAVKKCTCQNCFGQVTLFYQACHQAPLELSILIMRIIMALMDVIITQVCISYCFCLCLSGKTKKQKYKFAALPPHFWLEDSWTKSQEQ